MTYCSWCGEDASDGDHGLCVTMQESCDWCGDPWGDGSHAFCDTAVPVEVAANR